MDLLKLKVFTSLLIVIGMNVIPSAIAQTQETKPDEHIGFERANIRYTGSSAGSTGYTSLRTLFPLFQDRNNFTYISPQVNVFDNGKFGSNLIFGHRFFDRSSNMIFGGYLAYDNRDSGNGFFNQIGLGLEAIAEYWDLKANAYLPVGNAQQLVGSSSSGTFSGSLLFRNNQFNTAMTSVDLEAGGILRTGDRDFVRPAIGTYYLSAPSSASVLGVRGSVTYNSDLFAAGLAIQSDGIFGTRVLFNIGLNFAPDSSYRRPGNVLSRIDEFPTRNSAIVVLNQLVPEANPVLNPATGQPYQFFVVSDTPDANIANALVFPSSQFGSALSLATANAQNGVVYFYTQAGSGAPTIPGFTVGNGVKVVSSAPSTIPLTDLTSGLPIPVTVGTGVFPIVRGTVTLASGSNQIVSGYDIRPSSPGIIGTNNVNALLSDNRISVTTTAGNDHGIFLSGYSGNTNILRNTISNSVGAGILLQNGSGNTTVSNNNVTITAPNTSLGFNGRGIVLANVSGNNTLVDGNTVTGAIAEGIRFDNVRGTAAITNNTVLNTIQPRQQTDLEASIFVRLGTGNINLNISGNTVGDNNTLSALDVGGAVAVANEIDGIEVSICRAYPDGIGGCAATTTGVVSITNNIVRNIISNAANADGIDINLLSNAIARVTISNNNLQNISDKGISFGADGTARASATISNNIFNRMGEVGIQVRLAQTTAGTDLSSPVTLAGATTSGVLISGNQISNTGQSGIRLRTQNNAQLTATVTGNTITNANDGNPAAATDEGGILVRTQDTSIARVTLTNNTIRNTVNQGNSGGVVLRKQNTSTLCARLQNNLSSNPAVADYRFNQTGGGATGLQLSGITMPITTPAALQTALTAQGNTGTTFAIAGTASVPTAACIFP
jgi:parallel beta-helix repeat protein